MTLPSNLSYEQLEDQWRPLLKKFAAWDVPGMDREDLYQEMRIVLLKAQRGYNSRHNVKFITYLYRACLNRALLLLCRAGAGSSPRRGVIPPVLTDHLCNGSHDGAERGCQFCSGALQLMTHDDTGLIDVLANASRNARTVAALAVYGGATAEDMLGLGLTQAQVDSGLFELRWRLKKEA